MTHTVPPPKTDGAEEEFIRQRFTATNTTKVFRVLFQVPGGQQKENRQNALLSWSLHFRKGKNGAQINK